MRVMADRVLQFGTGPAFAREQAFDERREGEHAPIVEMPAPPKGGDARAVLAEFGFHEDEIDRLMATGDLA